MGHAVGRDRPKGVDDMRSGIQYQGRGLDYSRHVSFLRELCFRLASFVMIDFVLPAEGQQGLKGQTINDHQQNHLDAEGAVGGRHDKHSVRVDHTLDLSSHVLWGIFNKPQ